MMTRRKLTGIVVAVALLALPASGGCGEACGRETQRAAGCCCPHGAADGSPGMVRPGCCEMAPDSPRPSPPGVASRAAGPRDLDRAAAAHDAPVIHAAPRAALPHRTRAPQATETPPPLFLEHCVFRI